MSSDRRDTPPGRGPGHLYPGRSAEARCLTLAAVATMAHDAPPEVLAMMLPSTAAEPCAAAEGVCCDGDASAARCSGHRMERAPHVSELDAAILFDRGVGEMASLEPRTRKAEPPSIEDFLAHCESCGA